MTDSEFREYELVYIARPETSEETLKAINERLIQVVVGQGGEVDSVDHWGRRALAYPIDNHFEGYYVLHRFRMAPSGSTLVDLALRFNEDVFRYLLMLAND